MNTLEMMIMARENGKTYQAIDGDLSYSFSAGFFSSRTGEERDADAFGTLNELFETVGREEASPLNVSMAEIEERFGYPVSIIDYKVPVTFGDILPLLWEGTRIRLNGGGFVVLSDQSRNALLHLCSKLVTSISVLDNMLYFYLSGQEDE